MELVAANDPILRKGCRADFVVSAGQIADMFRLMNKMGGVGLAAPQVGIDARLFITAWGEIFINPEIEEVSSNTPAKLEGCLSLPGQEFWVTRHEWIQLADGRQYRGAQAQVIQHEMDHLNGVLISDIGRRNA